MTSNDETIKTVGEFLDWGPDHGYHLTKTVQVEVPGIGKEPGEKTAVQLFADRDETLTEYAASLEA